MTICIFAEAEDLVPGFVAVRAQQRGLNVIWLSESKLGVDWFFTLDDARPSEGYILHREECYPFQALSGAYVNLNPKPALPFGVELEPQDMDTFMGARRASLRHLTAMLPIPVANRLHAGRSNNSKAYQMRALAQFGFHVPDWLVSNDLSQVDAFTRDHGGEVVCKSVSGLRSRVRKLGEDMRERLRDGTTPIIAQQYIAGRDVRVHTINQMSFPTEIRANAAVDYRFDDGEQQYSAIPMPSSVESLCHRFAAQEGMVLAGFDFRVTDQDDWFCLEMNPVPTFMPYELETGQPICAALLDVIGATHESA